MVVFPTWRDAVHITLLFSWMNFNNSACFGYGFNVTKPSFRDTILKYFLQKYRTSFLHRFISLARALNSSGDSISFSPAFLIEASSSPSFLLGRRLFAASCGPWGFYCPRSRFSNLSIVGLSNPLYPISHHALSPLSGLGRTSLLLSSTLFIKVANVLSYEHTEDGTIMCVLNCTICSGESSLA